MEGPRLDKRSLSDDEQSTQFITQETPHEPAPSAAPPKTSRALPYVALVAVQLSYCVWHVLGKIAINGGTNPFVLALYRQAGACACLAALARCADFPRGGLVRAALAVSARDRRRFLALGCLGFGNIFGFVVALSYVTAFNSALLHPVIPEATAKLWAALGAEPALGVLEDQQIREAGSWGQLPTGTTVSALQALFPRIEETAEVGSA